MLTKQLKNKLALSSILALLLSPIAIMLAAYSSENTGRSLVSPIIFFLIVCSIPYLPILFLYENKLQLRVLSFVVPVVGWVLMWSAYLLLMQ